MHKPHKMSNMHNLPKFLSGWLDRANGTMLYERKQNQQVLYVIPISSILGKLPLIPVADTGTIPFSMRDKLHEVDGASCDTKPGEGDGCRLWYVNPWALTWPRTIMI